MSTLRTMTGAADGHSHKPKDAAITAVKNAYDAAPVDAISPCPYSGTHKATGVDFVHVPGRSVTERAGILLNSVDYRNARNANWHALKFRAKASPDARGKAVSAWGVGASLGPELDFDSALTQEIAFFNLYDPDLAVTKTVDKADAQAGDTLAYSVRINNVGTGAATAISLTDTLPAEVYYSQALDSGSGPRPSSVSATRTGRRP